MILKGFGLLASNTSRTKSYLHMMIKEQKLPEIVIVYVDDKKRLEESKEYVDERSNRKYFDENEPLLHMLNRANLDYIILETNDINSDIMKNFIKSLSVEYLIYSGYGGQILKSDLFRLGKKYIHVHAGCLPNYRGSTTAYYSLLQEDYIGATAIFLSEGIDEGEMIIQDVFSAPTDGINIDYVYEPFVRSCVLIKALDLLSSQKEFDGIKQSNESAETYYIIHPVLKHLVLLNLGNNVEGEQL